MRKSWVSLCVFGAAVVSVISFDSPQSNARESEPVDLWVDPGAGRDRSPGTEKRPFATIAAALAKVPDPLRQSVTIHLASGLYPETGGVEIPKDRLELMRRMAYGVELSFVGSGDVDERPRLAWKSDLLIAATEGRWRFVNVQVGTFDSAQHTGIRVSDGARVTLENVRFRTRSDTGHGIVAIAGGRVALRGAIEMNEHMHDKAEDDSFCGILAEDAGVVLFEQRGGARLDIGNGSLRSRHYGQVRLGCETARITSWGSNQNNLSIANGGRIDLRNTTTTLCAKHPKNTPIGLEHDGHILAEDAHIIIEGENDSAIALQKASTLTCNDIELRGDFEYGLWATSGSMFVGRFLSDVRKLDARTGATIHVEKVPDDVTIEQLIVRSGGVISLPDRIER